MMSGMSSVPETIALRPNEKLQYWRRHDLGDATLLHAHYGPFVWEKHFHDEQVVVISERGAGECYTRRGTDVGGPGSVWIFAPGEYHGGRVDGREWQYRALYLDDAALARIGEQFGVDPKKRLVLKAGLHLDEQLHSLLLRAHAYPRVEAVSEQDVWSDALVALFARYGDPQPKVCERSIGNAALHLARAYIAEHFRDDISIDDLARLCKVSRYHFIRAFRAAFGLPPHAYINQVRLQYARKLLLAGQTAGDAAVESGFYDQSRLNQLFKRCYGVTPARYAHLISL
jgi:AraC-like DNA-binding protein